MTLTDQLTAALAARHDVRAAEGVPHCLADGSAPTDARGVAGIAEVIGVVDGYVTFETVLRRTDAQGATQSFVWPGAVRLVTGVRGEPNLAVTIGLMLDHARCWAEPARRLWAQGKPSAA